MADDKKNIPETAPPAEAPAPTVENVAVPEQPAPEPVLTDAEAVMLEHEGQAATLPISCWGWARPSARPLAALPPALPRWIGLSALWAQSASGC